MDAPLTIGSRGSTGAGGRRFGPRFLGMAQQQFRADVSVNLVRRENLKEGDSVPIMVPKERIRIYPGITDLD